MYTSISLENQVKLMYKSIHRLIYPAAASWRRIQTSVDSGELQIAVAERQKRPRSSNARGCNRAVTAMLGFCQNLDPSFR
jgi:hypothetical protein